MYRGTDKSCSCDRADEAMIHDGLPMIVNLCFVWNIVNIKRLLYNTQLALAMVLMTAKLKTEERNMVECQGRQKLH